MDQGEGGCGSVDLTLLEVLGLAHLVGDVGEAEHRFAARLGESVEGRRAAG